MTTFARHERVLDEYIVKLEFRSVNHRYLDVTCRMPRWMSPLEERIKKLVRRFHERGKVDLTVSFEGEEPVAIRFRPRTEQVRAYLDAVSQLKKGLELKGDLGVSDLLLLFRDAIEPEQEDIDIEEFWGFLSKELEELLKQARSQAEREGEALQSDLERHLAILKRLIDAIEERKEKVLPEQKAALRERILSTLNGTPLSEERLLQEFAILADRLDITEELVRARSHIDRFLELLGEQDAVGRKLDFLLQELFREINTMASKAQDAQVSQMVVEAKGEVEKLREQVQNII